MIAKPAHEYITEDRDPSNQLMLLKDHAGFASVAPQGASFGDILTTAIKDTAFGWTNEPI